jgi:hypothetical protein
LQTTPLYDLAHAQGVFDTWRDDYNLIRPHEALALATPASQYQPKSVRPFPTSLPPIDYGPDDAVRVVHGGGQISFHGRFFFLSQALRGERVGVRPTTEDGVYPVHYCHQQVGSLNLRDPAVGVRPVDNIEAEV